ncbi:MAG: hypothetical protein F6K50_50155 [Moorea sp. SIO3I7]|nr:hypothetical protein [Moorena sp. SIO3E8]NEO03193.1 hypothetical protein [Moorena sp. SIO3I7]NEO11479.1 hypothetical protein [Moorena sp. SIO3E8]NEP97939.1 hypothetical protein [Moorena sp. SIO3F7]NEQ62367.1 hypothetical protein [Moorena sp. SIO4A1]
MLTIRSRKVIQTISFDRFKTALHPWPMATLRERINSKSQPVDLLLI